MGACDGRAAYYGKWDNFADAASKELKAEAVAEKEASEKCVRHVLRKQCECALC